MINVVVTKLTPSPVSSVFVRKILQAFLKAQGIVSDSVVEVSFVSRPKMLELGKDYLGETGAAAHNVLTFTAAETQKEFVYPPTQMYLGEIILCSPVVVDEAKRDNVQINEKVVELVTHGALHLLGVHHK